MELALHNLSGAPSGSVDVSEQTFGVEFNEPLVHQVVTAYLAGGRSGTKAQKSRSGVSGGGSKPWRQKGTGRARAGTARSPIWRGGGRAFAASPVSHAVKVNRKMYRAALRSILSELARQERLVVVDEFSLDGPKTRHMVKRLRDLGLERALIVVEEPGDDLNLAARNLPGVDVRRAISVDPVSLIEHEAVLLTVAALKHMEARLA